eukprot:TRINITY_DN21608_c0_g1_i2.p1 TRINITY_DN21608_c0_g1~~TRINITY_DN21608_c0_g1_i2.p1  ORF type:complete len:741 (-),score=176.52 TRINITY_DN21608_c0_g1_i2:49-2271(-)
MGVSGEMHGEHDQALRLQSLLEPVTECIPCIDAEVLQRHRTDLRTIENSTGARFTENVGLRSCSVLVSGEEASVERALTLALPLLAPSLAVASAGVPLLSPDGALTSAAPGLTVVGDARGVGRPSPPNAPPPSPPPAAAELLAASSLTSASMATARALAEPLGPPPGLWGHLESAPYGAVADDPERRGSEEEEEALRVVVASAASGCAAANAGVARPLASLAPAAVVGGPSALLAKAIGAAAAASVSAASASTPTSPPSPAPEPESLPADDSASCCPSLDRALAGGGTGGGCALSASGTAADGCLDEPDSPTAPEAPAVVPAPTGKKKKKSKAEKKRAQQAAAAAAAAAAGPGDPDEVEDDALSLEPSTALPMVLPRPAAIEGVKSLKKGILRMESVGVSYPKADSPSVSDVNLVLSQVSRVLISGAKGSGKTTVFNALVGELLPTFGTISRVVGLRLGHFAQNSLSSLDEPSLSTLTPAEYLQNACSVSSATGRALGTPDGELAGAGAELERLFEAFGLSGAALEQPLASLGRSDRLRLVLAAALRSRPQLLVLDEPAVSFDRATLDAFLEALKEFRGGVVVFSHTRDVPAFDGTIFERWNIRGGRLRTDPSSNNASSVAAVGASSATAASAARLPSPGAGPTGVGGQTSGDQLRSLAAAAAARGGPCGRTGNPAAAAAATTARVARAASIKEAREAKEAINQLEKKMRDGVKNKSMNEEDMRRMFDELISLKEVLSGL